MTAYLVTRWVTLALAFDLLEGVDMALPLFALREPHRLSKILLGDGSKKDLPDSICTLWSHVFYLSRDLWRVSNTEILTVDNCPNLDSNRD